MPARVPIAELRAEAEQVAAAVRAAFAGLSADQLAWKPSPDAWSIGECLDHLVVTDAAYDDTFDRLLAGEHRRRLWQRVPLLPRLWAGLLLRAVDPGTVRRQRAPRVFAPTAGARDPGVVERFLARSALLDRYFAAFADRPDLLATVISSPVAALVTYPLRDALTILVRHRQRHLAQAQRARAAPGFPTRP